MNVLRSLVLVLCLNGCAAIGIQHATGCSNGIVCEQGPIIEPTAAQQLLNLPVPNQKTVVAVYKFGDETGQRKPSDMISSFSTAVTQGAIHILIEALRDAGKGDWFVVE